MYSNKRTRTLQSKIRPISKSKRSQYRHSKNETELDILEISDRPSNRPSSENSANSPISHCDSLLDTVHFEAAPVGLKLQNSENSLVTRSQFEKSDSESTTEHEIAELDQPFMQVHCDNAGQWSLDDFKGKLTHWAISEKINLTSLSSLLKCLREHNDFAELPRDGRTLLQTPRFTEIKKMCGGNYIYIGILKGLLTALSQENRITRSHKLLIGVDGLPISRSSGSQLWPQLGKVQSLPNSPIFVIGLFHGSQKPTDANLFMSDLVSELQVLISNGFKYKDEIILIEHVAFVCDAPAKSFLLNIKGHSGFFSCTRCEVEGSYVKGRVCFPSQNCPLRTHEKFIYKTQEDHHLPGTSVLTEIPNFDIVRDIPLDYMHLVCLGAVKKILNLWVKGDLKYRLQSRAVQDISKMLVSFKPYMPSEFARKPRGLDELARWKATELRQFLLYTGPVILKMQNHLQKSLVNNFLHLSVAMSILLNPKNCDELQIYSGSVLSEFVDAFGKLYGKHLISHNIHGLLHIADDITTFGALDTSSAFQFEDHMQYLKKLLRKHHQPLQQIHRRLVESSVLLCQPNSKNVSNNKVHFERLHESGPLPENCTNPQYKVIRKSNFKLCLQFKDSFCSLADGSVIRVKNIAFFTEITEMAIVGIEYERIGCVFEKPLRSSKLNIFVIKGKKSDLIVRPVSEVFQKLVVLPYKQNMFVALPLIHTDF